MLNLNAPWEMSQRDHYYYINDNSGDFLFCVMKDESFQYREKKNQSKQAAALVTKAPELYEAAKEMIDLKKKLWYQGLDEIEQGVFNSVLAKLEITIEKIEKEAAHGS